MNPVPCLVFLEPAGKIEIVITACHHDHQVVKQGFGPLAVTTFYQKENCQ